MGVQVSMGVPLRVRQVCTCVCGKCVHVCVASVYMCVCPCVLHECAMCVYMCICILCAAVHTCGMCHVG